MGEQERKSTGEKRAGELKRRSRRKAQKRKALLKKRILMAVIGAAAVAMIIWGISALISSIGKGGSKKVSSDGVVLAQMNASQVVHLSFSMLSIDPKDGRVSAEQFQEILEWLYDKGYCLMDVYELAYVDEDGNYSYKETFDFPEGKIPLILSERDVCYPFNSAEEGVADRMLVEDGKITCQRTLENTKKETGKYDIVPIVESFINKHPDFSYNGARGVLGFTGYCGVLGYRTSPYLGKNADNPYAAAYGTFDTELEKENAQAVLEKLKDLGWRFASCGYAQDISYGSEFSIMKADAQRWEQEVEPVIGETGILILPKQTDIGSWKAFSDGNQKYNLLKSLGFSWFFVDEKTTPYLLQIRSSYVRQTIYEINTLADFQAAVQEKGSTEPSPTPAEEEAPAQTDAAEDGGE